VKDKEGLDEKIGNYIKSQMIKRDAKKVIFGLSGGIDSVTLAYICAKYLKENTIVMVMPDESVTPKSETKDAVQVINNLGLDSINCSIKNIHSTYSKSLPFHNIASGNLRARIRANILYYYANATDSIVVGTSDKSEYLIGYFTKFGDGACDIMPLCSLYKTQVRELAMKIGVPSYIINKKSSANLWIGHKAEAELGLDYDKIDVILKYIERMIPAETCSRKTKIPFEKVWYIYDRNLKNSHKRRLPDMFVG